MPGYNTEPYNYSEEVGFSFLFPVLFPVSSFQFPVLFPVSSFQFPVSASSFYSISCFFHICPDTDVYETDSASDLASDGGHQATICGGVRTRRGANVRTASK